MDAAAHGRDDGGAAVIVGRGGGFDAGDACGPVQGAALGHPLGVPTTLLRLGRSLFPGVRWRLDTHLVGVFGRGARMALQMCASADGPVSEAGQLLREKAGFESADNWHGALYGLLASAYEGDELDLVRAATRGQG